MSSIFDNIKEIHHWNDYYPLDTKYYKYNANIIFACCKIQDLYYQLCNARMSLHLCCDFDNYSMVSDEEHNIQYMKKYFIENSLMQYNIAVEYLWQMLWLYYDNSFDSKSLATNELYQESMKPCNFEALICGLSELGKKDLVEELIEYFTNKNQLYFKIKMDYNYIKHRGTFFMDGMGLNDSETMISIPSEIVHKNGKDYMVSYKLPMVQRKELDMEQLRINLLEFDNWFVPVCERFFTIIPSYMTKHDSITISEGISFTKEHLSELKQYERINPNIKIKRKINGVIKRL